MRIEFKDIIDSEKGKTAIVIGLGPSLNRHMSFLSEVNRDKENYCIISCNNIDRQLPSLRIDHWMLAQPADSGSEFYIPNAYERYNRDPNTTFYYTDCLDLTPRDMADRLLTVNWIGYDQRHNNSEKCGWKMPNGSDPTCCARIIPGRKTIQEEFRDYTGAKELYGCGDTVAVHMIANAVMLGCKQVYVFGVDLDYSKGYVNNNLPETKTRIGMGMSSVNRSPAMVERVLQDIKFIATCAAKIGTEVKCFDEDLQIHFALQLQRYTTIFNESKIEHGN